MNTNDFIDLFKNKLNKEAILRWLKDLFKKEALKKIGGSALGGVKLFLAVTSLNYIWKKWLGPGVRFIWRKTAKFFRDIKFKKKAKRLEDADKDDFDNAVDDLP